MSIYQIARKERQEAMFDTAASIAVFAGGCAGSWALLGPRYGMVGVLCGVFGALWVASKVGK